VRGSGDARLQKRQRRPYNAFQQRTIRSGAGKYSYAEMHAEQHPGEIVSRL
jgi:hypothetical protein